MHLCGRTDAIGDWIGDRTVSTTVNLELESRPECLALVRGMLVGIADLLGFDQELLHNLKTVVGEACNNVIVHAYDGEPGPLAVGLEIEQDRVEAVAICLLHAYANPAHERRAAAVAHATAGQAQKVPGTRRVFILWLGGLGRFTRPAGWPIGFRLAVGEAAGGGEGREQRGFASASPIR